MTETQLVEKAQERTRHVTTASYDGSSSDRDEDENTGSLDEDPMILTMHPTYSSGSLVEMECAVYEASFKLYAKETDKQSVLPGEEEDGEGEEEGGDGVD